MFPKKRYASVCAGVFALSCLFVGGIAAAAVGSETIDGSSVRLLDQASSLPDGWQHGAFIEVLVRAYQDSNGDGIGDLRGLTARLDYLRDLGIKGIWLMPVTQSRDHDHGYGTTDFRRIESAYGNMADFDELVLQAHARGIGVIMDYVINHSAMDFPLFQQSSLSAQNPYRNWFVWESQAPTGWNIWGKNPWFSTPNGAYFGTFCFHLPDFNLRNREVVEFHKDNIRFWLNRGLDGLRLDAVPHFIENGPEKWKDQPESRALTREFRTLIESYSKRYVVCEATSEPEAYAAPHLCGSAFAFPLARNIVDAARGKRKAIDAVVNYFATAPLSMATMVSNHDIFVGERLWDQLRGDERQYKLAAASYLLLPGTPFIYYGEEIGMSGIDGLSAFDLQGKQDDDAHIRGPMSWTGIATADGFSVGKPFRPMAMNAATHNVATEDGGSNSLLQFYRAMLRLRNTLPSIAQGSYERQFSEGPVMGFERAYRGERTFVLFNYGTETATVSIGNMNAVLHDVYPGTAIEDVKALGSSYMVLKPQSVQVFTVRPLGAPSARRAPPLSNMVVVAVWGGTILAGLGLLFWRLRARRRPSTLGGK